jgi:pimeloyl-ACP methyl ester carboxylesterase
MKRRWLMLASVALMLFGGILLGGRAAIQERRADFRPPRGRVPHPAGGAMAGLVDIDLHTTGAEIHGWYLASRSGALIVLLHGTGADRRQLLPEAGFLASAGYGLLMLDFPGHGESTGETTWDEGEREAVRAALDFAVREGLARDKIGVLGFSMGSMIAIQVAAEDGRVAALVVTGAFGDPDGPIANDFGKWGFITAWPAIWMAHFEGMHSAGRRPLDLVAKIAPRPIFIIGGDKDREVTPALELALLTSAREPKRLWMIPGAHHGDYARVAGAEYGRQLVAFYDQAFGIAAR